MNPEDYYHELGEEEWERLKDSFKNELEYINTIDYLEKYLPEKGKVLEAGGASGRYAIWLAKQDYEVTLLDITEKQLEIAKDKIEEENVSDKVEVVKGDIRDLDIEDKSYDSVLCLGGPLSHVVDEEDRYKAVKELKRVAKPNSPVIISVIGRLAAVQSVLKSIHEEICLLPDFLEDGDYKEELLEKYGMKSTFTRCHFFRYEEFKELLEGSGLKVEEIIGLEGLASNLKEELMELSEEQEEHALKTIKKLREDPTVADYSEHMLAATYKT